MPGKADPAIYPKLRENAMGFKFPGAETDEVGAVLMDWPLMSGSMTLLAGKDGSASIYLSSGGRFIGGGQKSPELREAAMRAVTHATAFLPSAEVAESRALPVAGMVCFSLVTNAGLYSISALEDDLKSGTSLVASLGNAMQAIVTGYRLMYPNRGKAKS